MENYSFLVLRNPSERTNRKMAEGVAGGTVRAASPGWPGRSPGSALNQDSSQPSPVQSMQWAQAALLRREWLRLVAEGCSPSSRGQGVVTVLGAAAALLGDFYFTLCVSIRAWRTYGSRTSLSPVVPRPMHWPVTLDFLGHCQHKYRTYSSKPCIQKKPNKVKETM